MSGTYGPSGEDYCRPSGTRECSPGLPRGSLRSPLAIDFRPSGTVCERPWRASVLASYVTIPRRSGKADRVQRPYCSLLTLPAGLAPSSKQCWALVAALIAEAGHGMPCPYC